MEPKKTTWPSLKKDADLDRSPIKSEINLFESDQIDQ